MSKLSLFSDFGLLLLALVLINEAIIRCKLLPAVIEHSGEKQIDPEAERRADDDSDDNEGTQAVSTVIGAVAKPGLQVRVDHTLVKSLALGVVRVDAPDNEDDYHGNDPSDDTSIEGVIKPLAFFNIVLVKHKEDEGYH